ncbi:MAG: cytochrome d ubiquinol oxidase subunit II [Streptosporangiales bacterium]|nr:cytochrome d ubiquinol oxidase subunit II [Streptosporangiales bacterium]
MDLPTLWFVIIAVLWTGYLLLEGFDFGVGALLPVVSRDETDRQLTLGTIGPVWDGNEVWLITAVGATFAAFPVWYASLLSGFYLPLLLILVALIVRGVALEYRGKRPDARWRARCDAGIVFGSLVPAFFWGVIFANVVRGVPVDARGVVHASVVDLLNPYGLLGGTALLALCLLHGAVFLSLKTGGALRLRARGLGFAAAAVALPALTVALTATAAAREARWAYGAAVAAGLLVVAAAVALRGGREGWAFAATAATAVLVTGTLFGALWPQLLPTTLAGPGLTVGNAASASYTLEVMSWVAAVFTPLVIAYQGWTYWVFRRRLTREPAAVSAT